MTPPAAELPIDATIERIVAAFARHYVTGAPFRQDRDLSAELALEARPAVEALLFALQHGDDPANVESPAHHESLALLTLLARRAGTLGATPTAALGVVDALSAAFAEAGRPLPSPIGAPLRAMCVEGFVAGRGDRSVAEAAARAADSQAIVTVVPRCLALFVAGDQEAEVLCEVVDRLGRALLEADAAACIVDMHALEGPAPDRATEIFGAHAAARMLGVTCVFCGASEPWLAAGRGVRVDTDLLLVEPSFEAALRRVLPAVGLSLRSSSWLPGPLKGLLGPK